MRKKFITGWMSAVLAGVVLIGGSVMTVSANQTTEVNYTQTNSYTVSIPATTLNGTSETVQTVSATEVDIAPGKTLQVKVSSLTDGKLTLTRQNDTAGTAATTTVTVGTATGGTSLITSDTVIAEFQGNSTDLVNSTTGKLYFGAVPADTLAGEYKGTLTYTLEVVDSSSSQP